MRWITFLLLLYLMYALQVSHLGALLLGHTSDDPWPSIEYLPLLAVFYALFATESAAPLAALACGIMYDVGNKDFLGTTMIPLALTSLLLIKIRLLIFREHIISHIIMTLLALLTLALLSTIFRALLGAPLYANSLLLHFLHLAGNTLYTALLAPAFFKLFFLLKSLLGFTPTNPRSRN